MTADKDKDPFRILEAEFLAGATLGSTLPAPTTVEIAFAGRSNVGKSSLINTLVDRQGLVRTSGKPGSTRQVNLFKARAADGAIFHLVDLPGYGFNQRSKAERAQWAKMIEAYLADRVTLAVVVLLVDSRRGVEPDDEELLAFVEGPSAASRRPIDVIIVATKLDKLSKSARKIEIEKIAKASGRRVIGFSSETGEGKRQLWLALRKLITGVAMPSAAASTATAAPAEADASDEVDDDEADDANEDDEDDADDESDDDESDDP